MSHKVQYKDFTEQLCAAKRASEFRIDHNLLPNNPAVVLSNPRSDDKYLTLFTFSGCNYNLINRRKVHGEDRIVVGSENKCIDIVQIPRRTDPPFTDIRTIQTPPCAGYGVWNIDQLDENHIVYSSEDGSNALIVWNIRNYTIENTIDLKGQKVLCYGRKNLFAYASKYVVFGSFKFVRIFDVTKKGGHLEQEIDNTGNVRVVEPLFNGCLATGSDDHTLRIFDIVEEKCVQTLSHKQYVWAITCVDKVRLVSADQYQIRVWNYVDGTCITQWEDNAGWIRRVVHLGSNVLAVAGDVGAFKLWDISGIENEEIPRKHKLLRKYDKEHGADVLTIEILGDGRMVTSGRDGTIRIWNITDKFWYDEVEQCFPRLYSSNGFLDVDIILRWL
jgi:WD40 repeat protein